MLQNLQESFHLYCKIINNSFINITVRSTRTTIITTIGIESIALSLYRIYTAPCNILVKFPVAVTNITIAAVLNIVNQPQIFTVHQYQQERDRELYNHW